jgi:hypothetical protein
VVSGLGDLQGFARLTRWPSEFGNSWVVLKTVEIASKEVRPALFLPPKDRVAKNQTCSLAGWSMSGSYSTVVGQKETLLSAE